MYNIGSYFEKCNENAGKQNRLMVVAIMPTMPDSDKAHGHLEIDEPC
jgi:hypothetical protein